MLIFTFIFIKLGTSDCLPVPQHVVIGLPKPWLRVKKDQG